MTDSSILDLYFTRSEDAITETDKKYGRYCRRIASNILDGRDVAEEAINDAYLRLWQSIPPDRPDPLKPYIGTVTRRVSLNRAYKDSAEKRGGKTIPVILDELGECIPDSVGEAEMTDSISLGDSLSRFLRSLRDRERQIFLLRYWYAYSVSDIAKRFFLRENTVSVLLSRTRVRLKAFLTKEGFDL